MLGLVLARSAAWWCGAAVCMMPTGMAGSCDVHCTHTHAHTLLTHVHCTRLTRCCSEAQHVVLAEPLLDPAVEAQAVGRVDRIGQTRATHVHR